MCAPAVFRLTAIILSTLSGSAQATETEPILVHIDRSTSPVTRGGKVVSFKSSYTGTINIGREDFKVVFDTGSGHIVVPSGNCSSTACLKHKQYNPEPSKTTVVSIDGAVADGISRDRITIGYGTGEVQGELFKDETCISGPTPNSTICVEMRAVMAIEMSPVPFNELNFDGIVGLGLPALTVHKSFSFFDALVAQGAVSVPHFSFYLSDEDVGSSELAIGGHNPARLLNPSEPLKWTPVLQPEGGHWMVTVNGVYVGGKRINICGEGDAGGACRGIVDSGSSHLGIPGGGFDEIEELLTSSAGELLDCRLAKTPEIKLDLGGFNLTLTAKNYMRRLPIRDDVSVGTSSTLSYEDGGANQTVRPGTQVQEDTDVVNTSVVPRWCRPRLLPVRVGPPLGPNLFMLGEPLLKQYYTVFDWSRPAVGFGESVYGLQEPDVGANGLGKLPDQVDVYLMQQKLEARRKVSENEDEDEVYMMQVTVAVTVRRTSRSSSKKFLQ